MFDSPLPADVLNSIALIEDDESLTYGDMYRMADSLIDKIPARALVLFLADNTIASAVAYVGFIRHHIIPLMVKQGTHDGLLRALIDEYHPSHIWCTDDCTLKGKTALKYRGHTLIATEYPVPMSHPELALLLSTSGSTGSRKYVRLSYRNIESNAHSIIDYLKIIPQDRAITTLPLSYSYGISILNSHLAAGASLVLTEKTLFDRTFWNLIEDCHVSTFGGVPYTYQMLKRLHFENMELPSLRYLTQAGGRLGDQLHREFGEICSKKGVDFIVMYGQTEGSPRLSYLPAERCLDKIGSIGIPIPGGEISLVDEDGRTISEPDTPGELIYEGPNVFMGYATGVSDLVRGDEEGGRLETGDIATRDADGFYRIVGRRKRFLKMFGNRVNLDDVESLLGEHGFIAACVGTDDSMTVYVEQGDTAEVQTLVSEETGLYRGAFHVKKIDSLPRNAAGKILYSELEA